VARRPSRATTARRYRGRNDGLQDDYRRAALRLFGEEREDVGQIVRVALDRGGEPMVQAALRAIERSYTEAQGEYHTAWLERFSTLNKSSMRLAAGDLKVATGVDFTMSNEVARQAAVERAAKLADFIGETSSERVTEVVKDALAEGGSVSDIVDSLREGAFGEEISLARAERIARTETGGALNTGQYEQAMESGIFSEKEWLHSGNRNFRDWHLAMNGERVAIDEAFSNGLMYPCESGADPAEVINCGCTALYYV
jgi:hypothetical protein